MLRQTSKVDPLFFADERIVAAASRSRGRKLAAFVRNRWRDLGFIAALLVVILSFRRTKAVRVIEKKVTGMVRSASQEGLRLLSEGAGQMPRLGGLRKSESGNSVVSHLSDEAYPSEDVEEKPARMRTNSMKVRVEGTADSLVHYVEPALIGLLAYKLCLLSLFSMPASYGFGVKRSFLHWASKAKTFRLWLRVAPISTYALVFAAGFVVRFSSRSVSTARAARWRLLALMNTMLGYSTLQLFQLIRGDAGPLLQLEETAADRDLLSAEPPPLSVMKAVTSPLVAIAPPVFQGLENIPASKRRIIFVGNHLIWGLDVPLLIRGLLESKGIFVRALGEHSWFSVPVVSELIFGIGAIDGTRRNCDLLMNAGENILVYPGGARESWKRTTDPPYGILWGEHHLGFVLMAVRHGYTIVPVASVGLEDVIDPMYDMPLDKMATLGGLLKPKKGTSKAFDQGAKLPLPRVKPHLAQRNYFRFMEPIETAEYQGQEDDKDLLRRLRDATKESLQLGIDSLKEFRKTDSDRFVFGKNAGAAVEETGELRSKM